MCFDLLIDCGLVVQHGLQQAVRQIRNKSRLQSRVTSLQQVQENQRRTTTPHLYMSKRLQLVVS